MTSATPPIPRSARESLEYVHLFRGGAIALVVLAHAKLAVVWTEPYDAYARFLRALIEGGDIPFFFVAGYLFQYTSAGFSYGPYLASRVRHVVLPYLFCSAPVLLHAFVFQYGVFEDYASRDALSIATSLVYSLLTAHHMFVPFWFIPTIVVLALLAPLLLWIDRHPKLYALVPPALVVGSLLHLAPLYLNVLWDAANVLPVYVLGMAVRRHQEPIFAALRRAPAAAIAAVLGLFVAEVALGPSGRFASARPFSTEQGMLDLSYLQKALLSLVVLERLERAGPAVSALASAAQRAVLRLADLSFGIFFGHIYVLSFLVRPLLAHLWRLPQAGATSLLGIGVAYLCVTTGLVVVAKRVLASRSRVLIGC